MAAAVPDHEMPVAITGPTSAVPSITMPPGLLMALSAARRSTPMSTPSPDAAEILRSAIKGQYHAALAMLRQAIERCPDDLWVSAAYPNRSWRMAYHTIYYTHL